MRPETFPELVRRGFYESCEDRLALTADPVDLFGAEAPLDGSIRHHGLFGGELQHHAGSLINGDISHHEVAPTLAEAHESTGLDDVRQRYGFRGGGQTAVVIDSGIAYDHENLGAGFGQGYRVVGGWDFTEENDADPYDDGPAGFHGTHVAGIIGSDHALHTGVAPDVDLVALRVFNDQGAGYFSWVEQALQWVHDNRNSFDNPITTVNLSLGTSWNDDSVPFGATLEDEFEQLKADGIFISVSAGNSFQEFNQEPGLSYPAASPWVVPVASVDANGNLSSFSQRNERVLAAPGEFISSTVPDYVFGADGVYNDFGAASGTSMAAPYVAGASVLLREAMEFVGYTDINQDTLYDHLWDTADVITDSVTGLDIHRINLENAFDALMPVDEDAAGAVTLSNVGSGLSYDGLITRLDDVDTFSFTADVTGDVTFALTNDLSTAIWQAGAGQTINGDLLQFEVTAGQSYTVTLAGVGDLCHYSFDASIAASATMIDLGEVDFDAFDDQSIAGEANYQLTATRDGFLSVSADWNSADGALQLEIYDAQQQLLGAATSSAGNLQIDADVTAGETVFLRVVGNTTVDLVAANLVGVSADVVSAVGTSGDDSVTIEAGAMHRLSVNGFEYEFDAGDVSRININAGAGYDTISITGTTSAETATIYYASTYLTGGGLTVDATQFENVTVNGGGGADTTNIYDTAGDETFTSIGTTANLAGDGFIHTVNGFARVNAYAYNGGYDHAEMYDSAGDDVYGGLFDHTFLYGDGFYNYARGFDRVNAYAYNGGYDLAIFHDTAGDDTFGGLHDHSFILGDGYYIYARGFERTNAYSVNGGYDTALFYDSAGDDVYGGLHDHSFMYGDGFYNYARGFDRTNAYATSGGYDVALFYDSAGDDVFGGLHDHSFMYGDGFYNYARGFDRTNAYATNGGYDLAQFYDSAGYDVYGGLHDHSFMYGDGYYNYARGFERNNAFSTNGGNDLALFYSSASVDTFVDTATYSMAYGDGYYNYARGFSSARANGDANDRAYFFELGADDDVDGYDDILNRSRNGAAARYQGTGSVHLYGDDFQADIDAVDYFYQLH